MQTLSFWSNVKPFLTGNLNQTWLAKEVGITPNNLSMMISRNTIPKADVAFKISKVLGVPLSSLLKEEGRAVFTDEVGEREFAFLSTKEEPTYLIPLTSTKIQYSEEEGLSPKNYIGSIRIIQNVTKGFDPNTLVGVHVIGDEMNEILYENDLVIFAKGHISSNGLYVIAIGRMIYVRRLQFNMLKQEISIMNENPIYTTTTTAMDDKQLRILGSVVGWIHSNHF